jgi:uncharacterized protein
MDRTTDTPDVRDTPEARDTTRVTEERPTEIRRGTFSTMGLNAVDWAALWLTIIGGLNWGLIGVFNFNLVDAIFGIGSAVSRIVYILVGLGALYTIYLATRLVKRDITTTARV